MARVLIIMGNPKPNSLCNSICDEYEKGAKSAGHQVEVFKLNQIDPKTKAGYDETYIPSEWVKLQQDAVVNCDHIVFITPMWWGAMTAALKSYIDQVFISGVTFRYREDGGYDKLCQGKTSEVIITSDTPKWVYFTFMGAPLIKTFKMHILEFCGFKLKSTTMFSPTIKSTSERRASWLKTAFNLGQKI